MAHKVWIDQDLCTGDGICTEIAPDVFYMSQDGMARVKETPAHFPELSEARLFEGKHGPPRQSGLARVPERLTQECQEAAEECPGECIFIEEVD